MKITYIICLLFTALVPSLQAAQPQPTEKKHITNHPLVSLFKIRGVGLEIVKYIGCAKEDGETALHWSARLGHLESIKYLLKQGVTRDKKENTTLLLSSKYGHLDIVAVSTATRG